MESGLLRTLTDKSAREGGQGDAGQGDADIPAQPPPATQGLAAPPPRTHRSRVFVIAGIVAATVLAFDAWLITHHRPPPRPSAAPPSAPSNALPTYRLLPLGTPPPPDPAPSKMPAAVPSNLAVVEEAAPQTVAPTPHRHRRGHHRH